jgi:PAS domain S-box-containing protein
MSQDRSLATLFCNSGSGRNSLDAFVSFLDGFPDGVAVIGPDARILHMNSRLKGMVEGGPGDVCYQALGGLNDYCPFCPFQSLINGITPAVLRAFRNKAGDHQSVDVRFVSGVGENGVIVEMVRPLETAQAVSGASEVASDLPAHLMKKLKGLLLVSRDLMKRAPFAEKMDNVLKHAAASLEESLGAIIWAKVDDAVFGNAAADPTLRVATKTIEVEGKERGSLHAAIQADRVFPGEDEYFLEETADLIGRQVEIYDLEAMLRQSEEKYRKLAGNLAKEMWSRTEALAKETGYLEGILRCSEDMIVTTDLDSRIVEFNPGAERMLGYTAEEMQGRKITDVWVDAEERDDLLQQIIVSGGIQNYQTKLRAKSGEIRDISLTLSLLKDEAGRVLGTVGVSKDVGAEIAFNRELERLNQNYRETMHFINHETKNSLIVISGFVRRLLDGEADPARQEQLKIVYHHAQFLEAMSRDFLVMAELEHGEFQARKRAIRNFYEEVILPAMVGLKERYPTSFESYDASMGGVGAIQLQGDPALLETVYRNLFGNALKYRHPNGKIAYGVVDRGDSYLFNVWNEGPGVPPDQVEAIFEKFYRVHNEITQEKRGTGLGLYNIRRIIEAHGGKIWCESNPGLWVNFLFVLPKK